MDLDPVFLSRIQFAFTISFHIIFPAFTIGLAAWLATLEGLHMATGQSIYRRLFDFWVKIFAVAFGMGVVSGIVMAFQFGTNWSVLSAVTGPIQGPLLAYEAFTAFLLEATFLGIVLFGRDRVPRWAFFVSALLVAIGTTFSSYWIMVNNSWMQMPVGAELRDGIYVPTDWAAILFSEAVLARFPHMLLGAYLTTAFCVAATGAWYLLRGRGGRGARIMLAMGLGLSAVIVPAQIAAGHKAGELVREHQPAKYAAMEGRWETEAGAPLLLFAIPDRQNERNYAEIGIPKLGSFVATGDFNSVEVGLNDIPQAERPPLWIPFYGFRIMVGCGLLMLAISWIGAGLMLTGRLTNYRWFLRATFWSFPLGFIAVVTGWFTAEVGRQPWAVQGLLTTVDAHSPIGPLSVLASLITFVLIYAIIFAAGTFYIYRLLRTGYEEPDGPDRDDLNPKRPLAVPGASLAGSAAE